MKLLWTTATLVAICQFATAHPGGLDSKGGHNDRKNGGYHYHRGPAATQKAAPASQSSSTAQKKEGAVEANPAEAKNAPSAATPGSSPALAKVTIGMSKAQVVAQLGEPNISNGDVWLYSGEGFVRFKGERVYSIEAK